MVCRTRPRPNERSGVAPSACQHPHHLEEVLVLSQGRAPRYPRSPQSISGSADELPLPRHVTAYIVGSTDAQ